MPVNLTIRGKAAIVTIDNPPVNVLSREVRAGLLTACAEAAALIAQNLIDRVVITGAGRAFIAGADAREFDGPSLDPQLPDVLEALSRLPAIAAMNGAALGGGYEVALACRARIAHPDALIGLPEVILGVVPGSGGTQRLPRLTGMQTAAELISTGRTVNGHEAARLGLVDCVSEDVMETALGYSIEGGLIDDLPAPLPVDLSAHYQHTTKRMGGQDAPLVALDLIAASTGPLDEGLARERAAFLTLRQSAQARALRHIFFAERGAGASHEIKAVQARTITTALIAGGGTMGAAIAYALHATGIHITLLEHDEASGIRARQNIARLFDDAVSRGKLDRSAADLQLDQGFSFIYGCAPLPPVDIAIEAVFEDLSVKKALFSRFSTDLPAETLLATNTSYLDVNAIFDGIPVPERCLGLHFFAPAHIMKLVEVIRTDSTSRETLASVFALTKRMGKIAVEAGVCDGFIGNRILTRYRTAADRLLRTGVLPHEVDAAMTEFGMAMGPYLAQDMSGLDIAYANRQRNGTSSAIADHLVEVLGRLGKKTGAGWYDYEDGKPCPSPAVEAVITAHTTGRKNCTDIAGHLVREMADEARNILAEGIANSAADIDLVMVHGYGFPRWRGGLLFHADRT